MSKIANFSFSVVTLLLVILTAALLQPECAADFGLRPWARWTKERLWQRYDPLPEIEALDRRSEKKWRAVAALLDGRVTLFEAAALFRRFNAEYPGPQPDPFARGDTDEERMCWQVIYMIPRVWASRSAEPADYLVDHFVEVLRRHKERYGKVVLPMELPDGAAANTVPMKPQAESSNPSAN